MDEFGPLFGNAGEAVFADPFTQTVAPRRPDYWPPLPPATATCAAPLAALFEMLKAAFAKCEIEYQPSEDNRTGMLCSALFWHGVIAFDIDIFARGKEHTVSFTHKEGCRFATSHFINLVLFPELGFSSGGLLPAPMPRAASMPIILEYLSCDKVVQGLTAFGPHAATPHYFIQGGIGVPPARRVADLFFSSSTNERILCMRAIRDMAKHAELCPSLREPFARAVEQGKRDANGHVRRFAESA